MKRSLLSFFFIMAALAVAVAQQPNYDTVRIRPVLVSNNLYFLKGSGGNIGVLIGNDGTLMIDDQFAPLSNKINGAIKTLSPGEIKFLINTHIHGDHTGGNDNFKKMGITILAQDQVRERMTKETVNRQNEKVPPRAKDALPDITFADKLNVHINDEDIELIHFDPGHTDGDVIVHFKKANVYHMGDMFVTYGYPFIDVSSGGSVNGMIAALDKILALMDDQAKVIPGHGELSTKADVKVFRDRLADIRDQVAAALKKGKKKEDLPNLGITDKYDAEWGKGFLKGKDFVMLVADNIAIAPKK
ncbi:Glyoxylase, beta-lactamase superfamily II [Chryseolinea serpens]|uniref:beta-lactamase n=1 Tax=Chryseolinea serpens TaxID=947013 RepID=A0A1M5NAM2_9BACT|nr:MBL fold metallo-hydrolase [Chryseolinea serpens]SHG86512.1 Glyoxylase, beta-lactamase superfamily II [Chryseolinea serpens]